MIVRILIYLIGALAGYRLGLLLGGPPSRLLLNGAYLALAGLLLGVLLAPRLEARLQVEQARLLRWLRGLPPEVPFLVTLATSAGLLLAVLLNSLFAQVPDFTPLISLVLAAILVVFLNAVALLNRDYFRLRPAALPARGRGGKVLDTSVLIDGRIVEVVEQGFLEGTLLVPQPVLKELQFLSDASDPLRRARGRRGLEVLERLRKIAPLEVLEVPASSEETDEQILLQARSLGAVLISNDGALLQLARIYGLKTLSIQALAASLHVPYQAGERIKITVIKEGREPGQGVGYLEDGTMVVVEGGQPYQGKEIPVIVTQVIQSQVGRMIFARLPEQQRNLAE